MSTKFCSNHEIFTTKIKTFANLERFTKYLCHENLELYGTCSIYSKMCDKILGVHLLVKIWKFANPRFPCL